MQIARWKGIVSRFQVRLVTIVTNVNGRYDDYIIVPMIRQVFAANCYELVENDLQ